MSFSIIRISKVKSGTNTTGIQKHVQRQNKNYENEDIDHSKTHLNYDLVNETHQNFNELIDKKIEENYTGKRKIRTDAIKHVDGLITSDNYFFNRLSAEDTKRFFEDAKTFLEQEYGQDNLLYATVHMDEKTPHMHYGVVPITEDGRLSAKEIVGNKKALTEFQDRFNEYVNERGYDLERGLPRELTEDKHDQVNRYKQKTEYHKKEYEHESEKLGHIKQENQKLNEEYQKTLDTLKRPLNIEYELEMEKVGGLFSKETQETGNVVLSKSDFDAFKEQVNAAQVITEDYEYIKSGKALKQAKEDYEEKEDELYKAWEDHDNLVDDYNELVKTNSDLVDKNEEKSKALKQSNVFLRRVFEMVKDVVPENIYHKIIDYIDDRVNNPKLREFMSVDKSDELFFKKKHQVQEPEIIFEDERDDGYTL